MAKFTLFLNLWTNVQVSKDADVKLELRIHGQVYNFNRIKQSLSLTKWLVTSANISSLHLNLLQQANPTIPKFIGNKLGHTWSLIRSFILVQWAIIWTIIRVGEFVETPIDWVKAVLKHRKSLLPAEFQVFYICAFEHFDQRELTF